jgi:hypothetical protein
VVIDLYAGRWEGRPLGPKDHIISADEETSIRAPIRRHPGTATAPGRARRVEFEYDRGGALQNLAAWDVRRGDVMGRCEPKTGIKPFGRLVARVREREPYRSADRVSWVVANGSSHRGAASVPPSRSRPRDSGDGRVIFGRFGLNILGRDSFRGTSPGGPRGE